MFEVVTIRAEYEGWWLFDDLWENVTDLQCFSSIQSAETYYLKRLEKLRERYKNEQIGKYNIHAFFNNCELEYCEDCGEDIQIFHSLIVFKDKKAYNMPC